MEAFKPLPTKTMRVSRSTTHLELKDMKKEILKINKRQRCMPVRVEVDNESEHNLKGKFLDQWYAN